MCVCFFSSGFDICIGFLCLKRPWSVFLGLRRFTIWFLCCCFFFYSKKKRKKQDPFLPITAPLPTLPPSLSLNGGRGVGVVSVPCGPSSLRLHGYTSLLLGACVRGDAHGPCGTGLRGGLPLSPESLLRRRYVGDVWRDTPATDLGGRGRGGHAGGHGAAAAVEALGRFQPGEHGQRVREVGGRRWCVGWGAHLRRKREKQLLSGEVYPTQICFSCGKVSNSFCFLKTKKVDVSVSKTSHEARLRYEWNSQEVITAQILSLPKHKGVADEVIFTEIELKFDACAYPICDLLRQHGFTSFNIWIIPKTSHFDVTGIENIWKKKSYFQVFINRNYQKEDRFLQQKGSFGESQQPFAVCCRGS